MNQLNFKEEDFKITIVYFTYNSEEADFELSFDFCYTPKPLEKKPDKFKIFKYFLNK